MPKQKTNKSAKKRFKVTANGRVRRTRSGKSHLMVTFKGSRVSKLRKSALVSKVEEKVVRRMLMAE